jgi:phosphoglucosamine mutase
MKPTMFGSSGIRGLANIELNPTLTKEVGTALATINQGDSVVIGRDTRLTGKMLELALISGINAGSGDVIQLGLAPTPVVAWMIQQTGSNSGVAITASHNPPEYNGLKIFNQDGMSYTLREQLEIEDIIKNEKYEYAEWDSVGIKEETDGIYPYVEMLTESININKEIMIGLDCFCGATSILAPLTFTEFPVQTKIINATPDGYFPAGNPEPSFNSLNRLGKYMQSTGCRIGFGFDGDGDRMMPLTSDGKMVNPDRVLAAYAGYKVKRNKGGIIVTHVGASMAVDEVVNKAGGKVIRTPVGDSFVTEAMTKHGAIFGGEPVGAWVFPEIQMCPSGVLSALKVLETLEFLDQSLEEFIQSAPSYPIKRFKLECPNHKKQKVMSYVFEKYSEVFTDIKSISDKDGLRINTKNGWALIRPSGTEPIIRVTIEGRSKSDIENILTQIKQILKQVI